MINMKFEIEKFIEPNQYPEVQGDKYFYQGKPVPRVTEILSSMLHEDYLMQWSNAIGLYKHQKYKDTLQQSADIGSYVHAAIENYLKNGIDLNIESIPYTYRDQVRNAFYSFKEWWSIIIKNDYKILMQEQELICMYFGGTLDLLIEINGCIYLIDFKTSNHPSYKYFLQLSAYRYMLRILYGIEIDGCIILMLDKKTESFQEMFLNFKIQEHLQYINYCEQTFLSIVYSYYNRLRVEQYYTNIFGGK